MASGSPRPAAGSKLLHSGKCVSNSGSVQQQASKLGSSLPGKNSTRAPEDHVLCFEAVIFCFFFFFLSAETEVSGTEIASVRAQLGL